MIGGGGKIKIIDFSISAITKTKSKMKHKVGTPIYIAPEVLKGKYNN